MQLFRNCLAVLPPLTLFNAACVPLLPFPIPGKITWPPYTISNGESQTPLLQFLLRGGVVYKQAIFNVLKLINNSLRKYKGN